MKVGLMLATFVAVFNCIDCSVQSEAVQVTRQFGYTGGKLIAVVTQSSGLPLFSKDMETKQTIVAPQMNSNVYPKYGFQYVSSEQSNGNKQLSEARIGDLLKGRFTVVDKIGAAHTINYSAGENNFDEKTIYTIGVARGGNADWVNRRNALNVGRELVALTTY